MYQRIKECRETAIRLYLKCQFQMTEMKAQNKEIIRGHVNSQQKRQAQERKVVASIPH